MEPSAPHAAAQQMSFGEHLDALRPHLTRSVVLFFILFVAAFCLRGELVDGLLFGPLRSDFPTNRLLARLADLTGVGELRINETMLRMVNTTLAGQFNLHLKVSMTAALAVVFPYLVWELWRFVRPALTPHEAHVCRRLTGWVTLAFFTGLAFGYMIIAPLTVNFLGGYRVSSLIENMIDVGSYLSTVLDVSLATAIVFQLPLLVWLLVGMGLLTSQFMRRYRRHAFVLLAVLSAIITPPDLASMVLVLAPLYGLYALSISIARRVERNKRA